MDVRQPIPLGGLDLETNKVYQKIGKATIAQNIIKDDSGVLKKRFGFDQHSLLSDVLKLITYYNEKDQVTELLALKADGLYKWSSIFWVAVSNGFDGTVPADMFNEDVEVTFQRGCVLFTTANENYPIMKYDGAHFYSAGVKGPRIDTSSGSNYYWSLLAEFYDYQGNVTVSPIYSKPVGNAISVSGLDPVDLPWWDFVLYDSLAGVQTPTPSFQFDARFLGLSERMFLIGVVSENPNFGHKIYTTVDVTSEATEIEMVQNLDEDFTTLDFDTLTYLSEIYDITSSKRFPPHAKHIGDFNGLSILGNLNYFVPDIDFSGGFPADLVYTRLKQPYSITWSDSTTGGSPESFPSLNSQSFDSSEFSISGVLGLDDVLLATKQDRVFFLTGNLVNGNYVIRDSISEGIGCISGQSFMKTESGGIFMSERGLYLTVQGSKPVEFSGPVHKLITSGNYQLDKSESVLDTARELVYTCLPHVSDDTQDLILVYNFKWKEWFTYTGIKCLAGIIVHEGKIYHTDGTRVYVEDESYNDFFSPISAKYYTSWLSNSNNPHATVLPDKASIISLAESDWTCTVDIEKNWNEVNKGTVDLEFSGETINLEAQLSSGACYSYRVGFTNEVLDEPFQIDSLVFSVSERQTKEKGDR